MKSKIIIGALCFAATISPAQAEEACTSAKDMIRMVKAFYGAEADLIDIINPTVQMKFSGINGNEPPDQILYRFEDHELYLDIDEEGLLQGFDKLKSASKSGELCRINDGEIAQKGDEDSTSVNMMFEFPFRRADGNFEVSELREGAKDGSKIMKGVAPGGLGFVAPGLKTIILRPADKDGAMPNFEFLKNGKAVSVNMSTFGKGRFFRLKDIKSSKADRFKITGDYSLEATFKIDPEALAAAEAKRLEENP